MRHFETLGMEVTPTPIINNDWGRLQAWAGGALGETEERWQNADNGDLDSNHLTFRRLVGVLVRCQPPSVASQSSTWSRSLVGSGGWLQLAAAVRPVRNQSNQEVKLREGSTFTAESVVR